MEYNEKYHLYDTIVAACMTSLVEKYKEDGYIGIMSESSISPFMWKMLEYTQACFGIKIQLYYNWIEKVKMEWRRKKGKFHIQYEKLTKKPNVIPNTFLKQIAAGFEKDETIFEEIYNEYYND